MIGIDYSGLNSMESTLFKQLDFMWVGEFGSRAVGILESII